MEIGWKMEKGCQKIDTNICKQIRKIEMSLIFSTIKTPDHARANFTDLDVHGALQNRSTAVEGP